ncbi:MAG: hypothetical protein GF311_09515 [Candidatus Lokiarchaeota archaeon]|nr:hypothetical protein [Candidatus Lokiarchaeota archaeon]
MKRKCKMCGMIRAQKDLVHFEPDDHLCFSCWNNRIETNKKIEDKK